MPGFLLNVASIVQCAHGGSAKPTLQSPRVKVMGQNVITRASFYTVSGCSLPPPNAGNGPCVTAQWTTAALRVLCDGLPVLLMDSQATCTPTGTPLVIAFTQPRVKGM
jgi:hypothetical protein